MEFAKASCKDSLTYVFDLDGVIYRGNEPQPQAAETIRALRAGRQIVRFYTNNSALTREAYADKLTGIGIPASIDDIMTSSYATALYFVENNEIGRNVYEIGHDGIRHELEAVGMKVITDEDEPDAQIDYVVVGIDSEFSYRKLARAQSAIMA